MIVRKCPYCLQPTRVNEYHCIHCGSILVEPNQLQSQRKKWLYGWVVLAILILCIIAALLTFQILTETDDSNHVTNPILPTPKPIPEPGDPHPKPGLPPESPVKPNPFDSFTMPNVIGYTNEEAIDSIGIDRLGSDSKNIIWQDSFSVEKGYVISQKPAADTIVSDQDQIEITVSKGYPINTKETIEEITVEPAVDGEISTISIHYSDARGDNIEWGKRTIDKSKIIPIKLVLSPEKDGLIEIYRQNQLIDYQDVKYDDILD